jgi:prepilin-type N-terminal cleavage/methylation domain-containing protein
MKSKAKNHGFTLIELLVVIAIIGILSSIVLVSLNSARSKARDVKRIAEIKQLMTALELYYDSNGHFPISSGGCGASSPNGSWCNSVQSLSGGHWIRDNGVANVLSPFMASEPIDPKQGSSPNWTPLNGGTIFYFASGYGGSGQWYMIVFGLENYPNSLENQDGVKACDGTNFHYGSGSNGIITMGASCAQ